MHRRIGGFALAQRVHLRRVRRAAGLSAIAPAVAHVEIGFDGEKRKFTEVFATEGNVRRSGQVDLVPLVHLGDPPAPGEGAGKTRRAPGHIIAPISFGSRTKLSAAATR